MIEDKKGVRIAHREDKPDKRNVLLRNIRKYGCIIKWEDTLERNLKAT